MPRSTNGGGGGGGSLARCVTVMITAGETIIAHAVAEETTVRLPAYCFSFSLFSFHFYPGNALTADRPVPPFPDFPAEPRSSSEIPRSKCSRLNAVLAARIIYSARKYLLTSTGEGIKQPRDTGQKAAGEPPVVSDARVLL